MKSSGAEGGDPDVDPREARARAGDRSALAGLLAAREEELRRWVERRLDRRMQGRVSASDVMQEVYLAAEQRLEHFGTLGDLPFGVWARLLAGQRLIDIHRRHLGAAARDAGREAPLGGGPSSADLAARLAGDLTSPSQAAVRHEQIDALTRAVDALGEDDREVIVLRHFEELSNRETAARLGISKDAASKRHLRALSRLKIVLEHAGGLLDLDDAPTPDHGGASDV